MIKKILDLLLIALPFFKTSEQKKREAISKEIEKIRKERDERISKSASRSHLNSSDGMPKTKRAKP